MILGTDVSLKECKKEGYTMIQFDARRKFNKDLQIRIFNYFPEYLEDIGGKISTDTEYSFKELEKIYLENKISLDSSYETNNYVNFEKPNWYDFLNLANDIVYYMGLQ